MQPRAKPHRLASPEVWLLLPVAALTVLLVWAIATRDRLIWVDVIFDDAYYYLGIARNVVEVGKSSFLPPFETNGYQPLWLALLSALGWVFGTGERALPIQLVCASMAFVVAFALAAQRFHGRLWPALLVSAAFPAVMTWGLETVMLPVFVLMYLEPRPRAWPVRGVLASAIFLTRLDALAFIVIRDAYALLVRRERVASLAHWLVLAPVVGLYFYANWVVFGTPLPVSGLAKAVGNRVGENIIPAVMYADAAKFLLPLVAVLIVARWHSRWHSRRDSRRYSRGTFVLRHGAELAIFGATAVACAGYYSLLSGWSVWGWYFWPLMFLAYYLVLESIAAWRQARASAWPLAATALLGLAALALYGSLVREALGTASRYARLGVEAARNRPMLESFGRKNVLLVDTIQRGGVARVQPGALIAMGDRAGSFGYFLGNAYRFIHTEGLVGPHDYVRALRADTGARYVDALRPDVLIAERERYFESAGTIGVAEPVQGWSVHTGPYLLCFDKAGIVASDGYAGQARLVIDYRHRTPCPAPLTRQFAAQRAAYGALREAALPSEYLQGPRRFVRARPDALAASPASPALVPALVPVPAPATQP